MRHIPTLLLIAALLAAPALAADLGIDEPTPPREDCVCPEVAPGRWEVCRCGDGALAEIAWRLLTAPAEKAERGGDDA